MPRSWTTSGDLLAAIRDVFPNDFNGIATYQKMESIRPMTPMDLLKFNPCNLDHLTETYNIGFYLEYFTKWPHLCKVIEGSDGQIQAYSTDGG